MTGWIDFHFNSPYWNWFFLHHTRYGHSWYCRDTTCLPNNNTNNYNNNIEKRIYNLMSASFLCYGKCNSTSACQSTQQDKIYFHPSYNIHSRIFFHFYSATNWFGSEFSEWTEIVGAWNWWKVFDQLALTIYAKYDSMTILVTVLTWKPTQIMVRLHPASVAKKWNIHA